MARAVALFELFTVRWKSEEEDPGSVASQPQCCCVAYGWAVLQTLDMKCNCPGEVSMAIKSWWILLVSGYKLVSFKQSLISFIEKNKLKHR